jgi:hypothetical protein
MKAEITHRVAKHLFVEVISAHVTTEVAGKKPFYPYVCLMGVTQSQQMLLVEKKRIKKVRDIPDKDTFFCHYLQFLTFGLRSTSNFCQRLPCSAIFSIGILHSRD